MTAPYPHTTPDGPGAAAPRAVTALWLWGPVALQMALIFGASSLSDPAPIMPPGLSDTDGHFIGYVLLSMLFLRALAARDASLAAFDERCLPGDGVALRSNTGGILAQRAWSAGRIARLGATRDSHHGLLAGGRLRGITWRTALLAVLLSSLYGVTDELHQSAVPGRTPDIHDIAADTLGACAAAAGGLLWTFARTRGGSRPVPL